MDAERIVREVKRLYFETSRDTLEQDFARARELANHIPEGDAARAQIERYLRAFPRLWSSLNGNEGEG
ncbi:MAG: hypothetical protein HY704_15725 [Gemmatimonadetes bacterium]|nr:hypothetical protein [Gemmatimonadota bacterium]